MKLMLETSNIQVINITVNVFTQLCFYSRNTVVLHTPYPIYGAM